MTVYMISGHRDGTQDEFDKHYKARIDQAVAEGAAFVVGDAGGIDRLAQEYLKDKGVSVTVYHPGANCRYNVGKYLTKGGYTGRTARDAFTNRDIAMSEDSDDDILYVRISRIGCSGTWRNKMRRERWKALKQAKIDAQIEAEKPKQIALF